MSPPSVPRHRRRRSWTESTGPPPPPPTAPPPTHRRGVPPPPGTRGWVSGLGWDALLLAVALFYIYLTPYTKVRAVGEARRECREGVACAAGRGRGGWGGG